MISTYLFVATVALYALAAAVTDVRERRIPNYLTVPVAILGLLFHTFAPTGWGGLTSLAGFAVGFGLLLMPWLLGGGGMGDVKLLAALGAWFGPKYMLIAFALSIAIAAAMALTIMVYKGATQGVSNAKDKFLTRSQQGDTLAVPRVRVLPFAVPVALCTWIVLFWMLHKGGL